MSCLKVREKRVGHIITSEEHRAKGPGFTNSTLNRDVTQDGIRIFVDGEGDMNPLFRDPEYANKTKYKCLIAPPNYLYTICYAQRPEDFGKCTRHRWILFRLRAGVVPAYL